MNCECGCCEPESARRECTKEEKLEMLKGYRAALKEKMDWLDEAMAEMKKPEIKKPRKKKPVKK